MIAETYRDVEIVLLEDENKWRFTANGRERTAPTLPKAREYIDNALDEVKKNKGKAWEPFDAYCLSNGFSGEFSVVKVTSVAETRGWDKTPDVWISNNGKRSKTSLSNVFSLSENKDRIMRIGELQRQSREIGEEIKQVKSRLVRITLPTNESD